MHTKQSRAYSPNSLIVSAPRQNILKTTKFARINSFIQFLVQNSYMNSCRTNGAVWWNANDMFHVRHLIGLPSSLPIFCDAGFLIPISFWQYYYIHTLHGRSNRTYRSHHIHEHHRHQAIPLPPLPGTATHFFFIRQRRSDTWTTYQQQERQQKNAKRLSNASFVVHSFQSVSKKC